MEWVTVERVALGLALIGYLIIALRWAAPRTATTIDDRAVAGIDAAKSWAERWAPGFWSVIEVAAKAGTLPQGTTKAAEFLLKVRDAYRKQSGADLPAQAEAVAVSVAEQLSAAVKLPLPFRSRPAGDGR
jgi:hypothetical protein